MTEHIQVVEYTRATARTAKRIRSNSKHIFDLIGEKVKNGNIANRNEFETTTYKLRFRVAIIFIHCANAFK